MGGLEDRPSAMLRVGWESRAWSTKLPVLLVNHRVKPSRGTQAKPSA